MSFFRYPGGKNKLKGYILPKIFHCFEGRNGIEYREPFFGAGSIGIRVLEFYNNFKTFWINDIDKAIYSLWVSVIDRPDELKELIQTFKPSVDSFYDMKEYLLKEEGDLDTLTLGFYKLALHQMSYSGLGVKSGSPLGGKSQKSKYDVSCRWSPSHICSRINKINYMLSNINVRCSSLDFSELMLAADENVVIYLDPPYFEKGNELYQFGFNEEDHIRLASLLKTTKAKWILSYDNCDYIMNLYNGWSNIDVISDVNYSIKTTRNKQELLITNF